MLNIGEPKGRLVKVTTIPIKIEDHPRQLMGLVRFSTESHSIQLNPIEHTIIKKKSFIPYRAYAEDEVQRGREMELYEISIATRRYKNKKFKLEVPINRGHKSNKTSKSNELPFTFKFTHSEGVLTLMNGQYEARTEFEQREGALSYSERLQLQLARLDHRRREELPIGIEMAQQR